MESTDTNQSIEDAIEWYKSAKRLEEVSKFETALVKYQCAAHILVDLVNTTTDEQKRLEYKGLANEILTRGEKWKLKNKKVLNRSMASYLFGKPVEEEKRISPQAPDVSKRRHTTKPEISQSQYKKPYQKLVKYPTNSNGITENHTPAVAAKVVKRPVKITVAKEIVDKLKENIITPGTSDITFSDIKGQKEIKKAITENIILPLKNPELFSGIREPARAILLYGPPGNGKTLLAKALAGQIKRTFFNISASSLMSKFMGEGEKLMRGLFTLAEELGPSIIFFDEIDSILSARGDGEHEASRRMKTEFLVQFDGVGSSTNGNIIIVAATNRPFDLDDAVLRRFPKKIFVGLPDSEARWAIITNLFKNENLNLSKYEVGDLVKLVRGYSSSDLTALCKQAAMMPLSDYTPEDLWVLRKDQIRPVDLRDFEIAMEKVRPSYGRKTIEQFIKWEKSLGK